MIIRNLIDEGYEWMRVRKNVRKEVVHSKDPRFKAIADTYRLTKEDKDAIDEFYTVNYGEKIPYIWHQYFTAQSGVFDPRYFPNLLLHPYFEHYINMNRNYAFVFEDKNVLPYIAKCAGVRMPRTILSRTCGIMRDEAGRPVDEKRAKEILSSVGEVFCKSSTGSYGGRGCFVADFRFPNVSVSDMLNSLGHDFVIQERLKCHQSIASIYPNSVNTFRVITFRWKESFVRLPVFMRVGQGGAVVDNGASGGMFLGVYEDGALTDKAVMPFKTGIYSHPDTGLVFRGHRIQGLTSVCEAAIRMHHMMPQVGMVYWDFTINTEGEPVLIECNILNGTVYAIQMTMGVPAFGEHTAEILRWIRKMKRLPVSEQRNYAFGKGI